LQIKELVLKFARRAGCVNFKHRNTWVVSLVHGNSGSDKNVVEVVFGRSVWEIKHVLAGVIPQTGNMVMSSDLNYDLVGVVAQDLEVL